MNERQFLKIINQRNNRDGIFTYATIHDLLQESKGLTTYKKTNIFKRIFSFNRNSKSATQIIADNFETILSNIHNQHLGTLLVLLVENEETRDLVSRNFDSIIHKFNNNQNIDRNEQYLLGFQQAEFLRALRDNPECHKIIEENFEKILESIPESDLFENTQMVKGINERTDCILNNFLHNNHKKVAKSLLQTYKIKYADNQEELLEDYTDTVSIIIKELLESENVSWIDVKKLGGGSYSFVYQIGDKVLKIGATRETYNIPNHTRILQPLTRINLLDEKNNNKAFACVEIADRVEKLTGADINEERLYEVYSDLRDDGIIWTDVRFDNVGILTKPNIPTLNGQNMDVAPHAVGFTDIKRGRELSQGEMVVLDTDWIYSQDSSDIKWQDNGYAKSFEKRWQQNQQAKIANKHKEPEVEQNINEKGDNNER